MDSGNVEDEDDASISSQNVSTVPKYGPNNKECGLNDREAGDDGDHGGHPQFHMGKKYLKVKMAPIREENIDTQQATIGEIESIPRNRWKNGFGPRRIGAITICDSHGRRSRKSWIRATGLSTVSAARTLESASG